MSAPLGTALAIDQHSAQPPSEQLRGQLVEQIMGHELTPGQKLPSVRALAAELGLAANTVAKVYRALESDGYLVTRGRNGTVVSEVAAAGAEQSATADRWTGDYVTAMRGLGIGGEAVIVRVREALARLDGNR